jgi:uncharacterized DUF497 family protein
LSGTKKRLERISESKVGFEEAKTVFNDPFSMTFPDPEHSDSEQRYLNIGYSLKRRVLIVVHTERGANIRIISCRKATRSERRDYEKGNL